MSNNELLREEDKDKIENISLEVVRETENICRECFEHGEHDPLGIESTVMTPYRKRIYDIVEDIIDNSPLLDYKSRNEVYDVVVSYFHEKSQEFFYELDIPVENQLKCYYCFKKKEKNDSDESIPIMVIEDENGMTEKPIDEWC